MASFLISLAYWLGLRTKAVRHLIRAVGANVLLNETVGTLILIVIGAGQLGKFLIFLLQRWVDLYLPISIKLKPAPYPYYSFHFESQS